MKKIQFDLNNLMSFNIGKEGVSPAETKKSFLKAKASFDGFCKTLTSRENRVNLNLEWTELPCQDKGLIQYIQNKGKEIAKKYENVLFLGIGGSFLGLKAAQDALLSPYYNEFASARKNHPKIYFEGNNLDPETLHRLLKNLNPKRTYVVVISKSGETTETKAAFEIAEEWLKRSVGKDYGRQIFAITDPKSGALRKKVDLMQAKDAKSYENLSLLPGVGGRFSEFNMGLLHLAICGIKIVEVLKGAADMKKRCLNNNLARNPAFQYAYLHYLLYRKKGKSIAVIMPFSEQLKSTADWYVQLLAESLGKKYARKIVTENGVEKWLADKGRILNSGRTPIPARGTNDLHSIQQNNIEGENNKAITFIKVEKFRNDLAMPGKEGFLAGEKYSYLLASALEATEWALKRENRPSCTIILPEISPYTWGALLFFFEMAVAFEGEFLGVNSYDQPGVESYKNYMYYKLKKPGMKQEIADEIERNPMKKSKGYIL